MTVEVKYVVIREGEEKMSFASKKEADAYDKMLDLAEVLGEWLGTAPVTLEDDSRDRMAMWLAEHKDALGAILKSGKLPDAQDASASAASDDEKQAEAVDIKRAAKREKAA